ncbi:MAG: phosphoribosyl-AMP cyclohydrolase [Opitutaceae bacterium]
MNAFPPRTAASEIELGTVLQPKFGPDGLIPCITTDHASNEVLMFAFMNAEALARTVETGRATYWSRSRGKLWIKGEESGHVQRVKELRVDCDQDVILLRVENVGGAACHNGYRSCFYRRLAAGANPSDPASLRLEFAAERVVDPATVYRRKPH